MISRAISGTMADKEIEDILERGSKSCLLIFDGYDEYLKNRKNSGWFQEVIDREAQKDFNLIVKNQFCQF